MNSCFPVTSRYRLYFFSWYSLAHGSLPRKWDARYLHSTPKASPEGMCRASRSGQKSTSSFVAPSRIHFTSKSLPKRLRISRSKASPEACVGSVIGE